MALRGGGAPTMTSMVKTPAETYHAFADKGAANAKASIAKTLHQSVIAGGYIGFGALLSLTIAGNVPGIKAENPGIPKFIFAALFPVNLLLILQSGGQLFTGNTAVLPAAICEGKATFGELVRSWIVSFFGNLSGCILFAFMVKYSGLLSGGVAELALSTGIAKVSGDLGPTIVKAIMCNWLVCMAVFLSTSAYDLAGKMVGIWFPISAFVAIGCEHSVANMFILPLAMLVNDSPITVSQFLLKNLIPVSIGNAIAGALIVGCGYSFAFGKLGENY